MPESSSSPATGPRLAVTAALAAGMVCLPASAQAAGPATGLRAAAAPAALCDSGATNAADQAVADRVRPAMNGRRLGRSVAGRHIACARLIIRHVQERGLPQRAAVIAVTTAITESTLHNYLSAVDHDSLGLFQQRPSQGWGRPGQLTDARYSTWAFLDAMLRKYPGGKWMTGDIGAICQRVQISAFPMAYAPEVHDAQILVAALWAQTAVGPAPSAVKAAAGPFQRALVTAGTELGPLQGHHDVLTADWSGDGRPDLLVVKGGGTATGKTDVWVMDGATSFAALSANVATPLGPTDARHSYLAADVTGDKRADLLVVQRSGTASGRTELRILDGSSAFRRLASETATALPATDDRHRFAAADFNADGKVDLVMAQTSGTASGKVEVQVLDGATDFQRPVTPPITTTEPVGDDLEAAVTDWNGDRRPDLVLVRPAGTAGKKTELRVLDGASGLGKRLATAVTAAGVIDDRHDLTVTDWNADGRPDLAVIQKTGTASGRAEVRILGG
ncbi:VCBS repeat-containing protein [Actinoplanes sp. NPDC049802]|uniref:FG-GAP repeat domain-containing protein n=1 Tax=Actinoplanes sp. NPDC049802 TaxID=3154742 RepID=UPI0033CFD909